MLQNTKNIKATIFTLNYRVRVVINILKLVHIHTAKMYICVYEYKSWLVLPDSETTGECAVLFCFVFLQTQQ